MDLFSQPSHLQGKGNHISGKQDGGRESICLPFAPITDRHQGILERSVVLTSDQRVYPFMEDLIVHLILEVSDGAFQVGGDHGRLAYEARKDILDGGLEVVQILPYSRDDIVRTNVACRDD